MTPAPGECAAAELIPSMDARSMHGAAHGDGEPEVRIVRHLTPPGTAPTNQQRRPSSLAIRRMEKPATEPASSFASMPMMACPLGHPSSAWTQVDASAALLEDRMVSEFNSVDETVDDMEDSCDSIAPFASEIEPAVRPRSPACTASSSLRDTCVSASSSDHPFPDAGADGAALRSVYRRKRSSTPLKRRTAVVVFQEECEETDDQPRTPLKPPASPPASPPKPSSAASGDSEDDLIMPQRSANEEQNQKGSSSSAPSCLANLGHNGALGVVLPADAIAHRSQCRRRVKFMSPERTVIAITPKCATGRKGFVSTKALRSLARSGKGDAEVGLTFAHCAAGDDEDGDELSDMDVLRAALDDGKAQEDEQSGSDTDNDSEEDEELSTETPEAEDEDTDLELANSHLDKDASQPEPDWVTRMSNQESPVAVSGRSSENDPNLFNRCLMLTQKKPRAATPSTPAKPRQSCQVRRVLMRLD